MADGTKKIALIFFEDGNALHLVLRLSDLGKDGTYFISKDVPPDKLPSDKNPYASVSHILCDNDKPDGKKCGKKVRWTEKGKSHVCSLGSALYDVRGLVVSLVSFGRSA